jgi:hypothetical protein
MKKILSTLVAVSLGLLTSKATVILNETFTYADGPLTGPSSVSSGAWFTHSGTTGQVNVASGAAIITQAGSEDISTAITNATFPTPFTTEVLYVSFKVNFSTAPGAGTYFAHFRDAGTGFRCRLFANNTGAAPGKFRLGIQNFSASTTNIQTDLDPSVDYKVVIRFQGSTNATIWINPTSEGSIVNRADGNDLTPNTYNGTRFFAFRQGANTQGICTIDDLKVGTLFSDVQTIGGPPSISGLSNVGIPASSNTGPMPFVISDVETPAASLTLTAYPSNPTLTPSPASFSFGGSGENRTLTVTPASGVEGTSVIDVVVTDGSAESSTNTFTLVVGAPTISSIVEQSIATNTFGGPVAFTVGDNETSPGLLTVSATSSNTAVIADTDIAIQNLGGGSRTITFTNIGTAGVTEITVTVTDGTHNISTKFVVTAFPLLGLVLADDFSYADGSITNNTLNFWASHSGTTGADVLGGKLRLYATNSADINAFLTNTPYTPASGTILYSRFVVNFSVLPTATGTGEYFAHFKEFANTQFRARIFATTNGAASGHYRIGIANGGFASTTFPWDLTPGASYVIISRLNIATGNSRLWVSPVSESSPSVDGTDSIGPVTIYSYAFRQNAGIGGLSIDNLAIGSTFADVQLNITPSPSSLTIQQYGTDSVVSWSDAVSALQTATSVTGPYSSLSTATSPYTNAASGNRFFRLKY